MTIIVWFYLLFEEHKQILMQDIQKLTSMSMYVISPTKSFSLMSSKNLMDDSIGHMVFCTTGIMLLNLALIACWHTLLNFWCK